MKEFNCNISPKHIYVIINENRNNYKDKILTAFNIKVNDEEVSNNISSCSVETAQNNSSNSVSKEFDKIISSEQWKNIMLVQRLYGRRFKYVLQSGWTDIIAEKAQQQQKNLVVQYRLKSTTSIYLVQQDIIYLFMVVVRKVTHLY